MLDIDFYQHLFLATWLFLIFWRWFNKHLSTMYVLGVGLLWEAAELFYNMDAYVSTKYFLLDSVYDMTAAIIGSVFCIFVLIDKE